MQLVVSTYKKLGLRELPTIPDFGRMTGGLGQALFDPPNVAGWAGGRTWITPSTLLQRGNLFRDVLFPGRQGLPPARSTRCRRPTRASARTARARAWTSPRRRKEGTGDAESNMMVDRDEDYNTRYGGYTGYLLAFERTQADPAPRRRRSI